MSGDGDRGVEGGQERGGEGGCHGPFRHVSGRRLPFVAETLAVLAHAAGAFRARIIRTLLIYDSQTAVAFEKDLKVLPSVVAQYCIFCMFCIFCTWFGAAKRVR